MDVYTESAVNDPLERNKQTAKAFYDLMFNQCRPREAIVSQQQHHVLMSASKSALSTDAYL